MQEQQQLNYNRIAQAIRYIGQHFKNQPSLEQIAESINLSPFHFQRLFTEWAGVSPKKFLQYISIEYAKNLLKEKQATLFDAAMATGLSGTGRLHDLFINIEGMTPGEYKNGGENLSLSYSFAESPFGLLITASTQKGICYMAFADDAGHAYHSLKDQFPNARLQEKTEPQHLNALHIFTRDWSQVSPLSLHLKGSEFQLKVWEALLKIPLGGLSTYGQIAGHIGQPSASRAVGAAVGSNPVAFLIPCHRVIQSGGTFGGYLWGPVRKTAMIGWEAAHISAGY